jgi:hypothetical protein
MHFVKEERGEPNLDTLSPQRKTNASITPTIEEASKGATCLQNQFCLLRWRNKNLHYYAYTIYTVHMSFYIAKMPSHVKDSLKCLDGYSVCTKPVLAQRFLVLILPRLRFDFFDNNFNYLFYLKYEKYVINYIIFVSFYFK